MSEKEPTLREAVRLGLKDSLPSLPSGSAWQPHVPLATGVLIIVLTQVLCAWWIASSITRAVDRADNGSTLESMDRTLDGISSSVDDIAKVATNVRRY